MISSFILAQNTRKNACGKVVVYTLRYRNSNNFSILFCNKSSNAYSKKPNMLFFLKFLISVKANVWVIDRLVSINKINHWSTIGANKLVVPFSFKFWVSKNKKSKAGFIFLEIFILSKTLIRTRMGHNVYVAWSLVILSDKIHLVLNFGKKLAKLCEKSRKIAKFWKKSFYLEFLWKMSCWRNDCDHHRRLHGKFKKNRTGQFLEKSEKPKKSRFLAKKAFITPTHDKTGPSNH